MEEEVSSSSPPAFGVWLLACGVGGLEQNKNALGVACGLGPSSRPAKRKSCLGFGATVLAGKANSLTFDDDMMHPTHLTHPTHPPTHPPTHHPQKSMSNFPAADSTATLGGSALVAGGPSFASFPAPPLAPGSKGHTPEMV